MPVLVVAVTLLGLAVGSFLTVVIHRVPRGESLVRPGSHCPHCAAAVRTRHNVPVLGWIMLRGRCADCAGPISPRYPLVEAGTAALFAATTVAVAHLHALPALPAYLFFVAVGVALAGIDIDVMRLPNAIVYPSYGVLAGLLGLAAAIDGSAAPLLRAAIGAGGLFAFFLLLAVAQPGGLGFGDVKLAGLVGGVLGYLSYPALLIGVFAAFLFGGVLGAVLLASRRATRKSALPFGPALITGALVSLFAAAPLLAAYPAVFHQT